MSIKKMFLIANRFRILILASILFLSSLSVATNTHASAIISNWNSLTPLPEKIANQQILAMDGYLISVAGSSSYVTKNVYSSLISSNGSLSTWNTGSALPFSVFWHSLTSYNNNLYLIGGNTWPNQMTTSVNSVMKSTIESNGTISSWTDIAGLPEARADGAAIMVNNRIYYAGGGIWMGGGSPQIKDNIYMASIDSSGNISGWQNGGTLPRPLLGMSMIYMGNKVIVLGGILSSGQAVDEVWFADIGTDGKLTNWQMSEFKLPNRMYHMMAAKWKNYIVIVGGRKEYLDSGQFSAGIYYSSIGVDGKTGTWIDNGSTYDYGRCCAGVTVVGDRIYITGGHFGTDYYSDVDMALLSDPVPTPTPTPTPIPLTPLILIPGMGASWNYEALIHGQNIADTSWQIAPYVNHYDGLIKSIENAGYIRNQNFWVYAYDWRRNVGETANNLSGFIANKVPTGKVNIVGHSLGGIVARSYVQNNPGKVDKLITAGSPFQGSAKVYKIWEGADLSDFTGWEKIAVMLYLRIARGGYDNSVKEIQALVPSFKNILPTFDYLKNKSGAVKQKNNYLANLISTTGLSTLSGDGKDTLRWIKVTNRNVLDEFLGKWEDGKPVGEEKANGDGTVLDFSSKVSGAMANELLPNTNHGELVTKGESQTKILQMLGLTSLGNTVVTPSWQNAVVVAVASPVSFQVKTPDNKILEPSLGILAIDNPTNGEYHVLLTASASGSYRLLFGRIKNGLAIWEDKQDSMQNAGEKKDILVKVDFNQPYLGGNPQADAMSRLKNLKIKVGGSNMNLVKKNIILINIGLIEKNWTKPQLLIVNFNMTMEQLKNTGVEGEIKNELRLIKANLEY